MQAQQIKITTCNSTVESYLRKGLNLVPIPPGTKGPSHQNWNEETHMLEKASDLPSGWGIGLAHAYSSTCAIDIDDYDIAKEKLAEKNIDLDALLNADDAVQITSGRKGRGKLIYKLPFTGATMISRKLTFKDETNATRCYLELRCATANDKTVQDVLPPSVHPVTNESYRWAGKGKWENLPVIPSELLNYWSDLEEESKQRSIPTESIDCSWEEVESALEAINPDVDRDEWLHVAMALHDTGTKTDKLEQSLQLFNEWSSKGEKYKGEFDVIRVWNSLKPAEGITIGTLFKYAKDNGWKKPLPDVSTLFGDVSEKKFKTPLEVLRPPGPALDFDYVPDLLAQRSQEVAKAMGCDPIIPFFAGMSATCASLDSRIRLKLTEGFLVPPVLWFMIIGEPADKKTPASKAMLEVLKEIELEDKKDYDQRMQFHKLAENKYKKEFGEWEELADSEEMILGNDVTGLPPATPPPEPVRKRIIVSDITSQKLVTMCEFRPQGMLCHLDEMSGWMRQVTSANSGDNRSSWTKGFECNAETFDRMGGGEKIIDHFAISMFGNVQPDVFQKNVKEMSTDGMLQRFIPAVAVDPCTVGEDIPRTFTHADQYDELIKSLNKLPEQLYTLSPEAYELFREHQHWYNKAKKEEKLIKGSEDKTFMGAFGKNEGMVGRIALVWHMFDNPTSTQISKTTLQRAIRFTKEFYIPSLRHVYGEIGGVNMGTNLDSWMADYIVQNSDSEYIKLTEIKASARRQFESLGVTNNIEKINAIRDSMIGLEIHQWVAVADETPRNTTWAINPKIHEMFKEYRLEVIRIKQNRIDEIKCIVDAANARNGKDPIKRKLVKGYDPKTMDEKD